jgi:hypothetical protein
VVACRSVEVGMPDRLSLDVQQDCLPVSRCPGPVVQSLDGNRQAAFVLLPQLLGEVGGEVRPGLVHVVDAVLEPDLVRSHHADASRADGPPDANPSGAQPAGALASHAEPSDQAGRKVVRARSLRHGKIFSSRVAP